MSRNLTTLIAVFLVFIATTILGWLVWANTVYARDHPIEKEFLVPWLAARTFLHDGDNPYGESATQHAQMAYYGRLAVEGEDPLRLATMLPVEFFYFPFALIKDYSLARGLWMALGEIALVTGTFLCLSLTGWKPRKFLLLVVILFSLFWIYAFNPLRDGSPTPFVALGLLGALFSVRLEKDELAGALLALSLLEPGIAAVFLLFVLWHVVVFHRWRIFLGFLMAVGFFTVASFLLLPSWFIPFLQGVLSHSHYSPGLSTSVLLADWWPVLGPKISIALSIGLGAVLFLEWRHMRGKDFRHVLWVASLTLAAVPLTGLPVSQDEHLLLFLPFTLLLSIAAERWTGVRGSFFSSGILIGVFLLLWLISGNVHARFLLLPVLLFVGLYWMRLWAVHPPRTWSDTLK